MSTSDQTLPAEISNFFLAMQAGKPARERMATLFAEDAVYVEPFSGSEQTHQGREAIIGTMAQGWEQPLPEMSIAIDRVETGSGRVSVAWTCYSPALPGGKGSGVNEFELADGQITKLVTRFT